MQRSRVKKQRRRPQTPFFITLLDVKMMNEHPALVTNIQGYSIHDGPGIRTVVFLKGCSLACRWCSNPECIDPRSEVGLVNNLCTACGKCAEACPAGALVFTDDKPPVINRKICTGCGACVLACVYKALVLFGQPMTADEIFETVKKDKMFYDSSGGGVTVSGGEALLQSEHVTRLFEKCHQAGIHTCTETSGQTSEAAFRQVLEQTDLVLFDLKHLNTDKHRIYTGQPNERILSNARIMAASGIEFLFRMPLIPGVNDDPGNVRETSAFLDSLGNNARRIELMPYHRLGQGKYEMLGIYYQLTDVPEPLPEHLVSIKSLFEAEGIKCSISL